MRYATVEDVDDPRGFNRVRVRVEGYHSPDTPTSLLPWAQVASWGGGMPDSGAAPKYLVGASVMVVFERGNPGRPWVLFGVPKETADFQEYGEDGWAPESDSDNDCPQEATDNETTCVFKTPKGAALYVDEADGQEKLVLVDRAGQAVEMVAPVTEAANAQNAQRRGTGLASAGTGLKYSAMAGPAYVKATGMSGDSITVYSEDGEEKIELDNASQGNSLTMDKDGFVLEVLGGKDGGGLTIVGDSSGLRVNGLYLVTENLVAWLDAFKATLTQSTRPGDPGPLFPTALAAFNSEKDDSMNATGHRTRI